MAHSISRDKEEEYSMMFYTRDGELYSAEMNLFTTVWTIWHNNEIVCTNLDNFLEGFL